MAPRLPGFRSLTDNIAHRLGWRRSYDRTHDNVWTRVHNRNQIDDVLTEQCEAASILAPDHAALATVMNIDALHVQPAVLEVYVRVLDDVLYLEGVLVGARNRGLPKELVGRLQAAVDHGRALSVLLADAVRATTIHPGNDA
ncbi:hypothetical protein ABT272_28750 [Streptomyces sp900105245]|uniref:Uncharacterized protein n=1 Tax=Streptomyces sp. 900105245 TaxID=3154379 RepID=A0ABV1UDA7_9ACTN